MKGSFGHKYTENVQEIYTFRPKHPENIEKLSIAPAGRVVLETPGA